MIIDIVKVLLPSVLAFTTGILLTPFLTGFLYRNEMWKKKSGKVDLSGNETKIFNKLHEHKDTGTPRMGGIVIWFSALFVVLFLWLLARFIPIETFVKLEFMSRDQTWIPVFVLLIGAGVGMIDDWLEIKGVKGHVAGGLSLKKRLIVVGLIGLGVGYWFWAKLGVTGIGLPGGGLFEIGWLIIPLFAVVMGFIYSGGTIDGIDGLAGGVFASIFMSYAGIAFYQQQIDLAAFCAVVVGGILAFLWFNIPPARFYMSETGSMALTITIVVVAFITDSHGGGYGLLVLPIIAFPLVATTITTTIQVLSKKLRNGKKVFLVAPIHHHFEALGWPAYKVTMRYWIISVMFAVLGLSLALIG
jgi:phospho-N-acetylmuramoyl-pentapeptide-transferase